MSYRDQSKGLDLHIVCFDVNYEEDYHVVTCRVTYPGLDGQAPITVDYNPGDDSELTFEVVRAKILEDIATFIQSPESWVQNYVKQSKDARRELLQVEMALEQHKQDAIDHSKQADYHRERVTYWQGLLEELQKRAEQ